VAAAAAADEKTQAERDIIRRAAGAKQNMIIKKDS
jgi:hypothetical protein